jgi:hypothetical protein
MRQSLDLDCLGSGETEVSFQFKQPDISTQFNKGLLYDENQRLGSGLLVQRHPVSAIFPSIVHLVREFP